MRNQCDNRSLNDTDECMCETGYPKLAKKSSDGAYCYYIQRRLSAYITGFSIRRGISANWATFIDFIFALFASLLLYQGYYITGVVFIQLFGIWSCVDGEIARITKTTSKLGDYFDTMIDRTAELLIVGALMLSMHRALPEVAWGTINFGYIGAILLITASSEKFRSSFNENYPKNSSEPFFYWLCAGSDTRLFYLSLGIVIFSITGIALIIKWLIISMTILLGFNFMFRLWKIPTLISKINQKTR